MNIARTLIDVIDDLADFDDNLAIYSVARSSLAPESPAIVCYDPEWEAEYEDDKGYPPDKTGLTAVSEAETAGWMHVLVVFLAKEAIEVWSEWRGGRQPLPREKYEAVIYYATYDAYLPLDMD